MKPYDGFEPKKTARREILPAGGYVAQIKAAQEQEYTWGTVLSLSFDIAEGENRGFFARDYRQNTRQDKRWRGTFRLTCPTGDGSEKDGWARDTFNNAVAVLQESNPGYTWDWGPMEKEDYSQLRGKLVGVLFRNREWEMDGRTGWATEACALIPAEDVRGGHFRMPADKPLPVDRKPLGSGGPVSPDRFLDADEDLPF